MRKKCATLIGGSRAVLCALFPLLLFDTAGQLMCDALGYEQGIGGLGIGMALSCGMVAVVYGTVRLLYGKEKGIRTIATVLGILFIAWLAFVTVRICIVSDPDDAYGSGWSLHYVNKLEEERALWAKTHWFRQGETFYEYDDSILDGWTWAGEEDIEEPYASALDERDRAAYLYEDYNSATMLNILSYCYGRWIWLLYLLTAIVWTCFGLIPLLSAAGIRRRILYAVSFGFMLMNIWLPAMDACGLVYSYFGPPFTGTYSFFWEVNLFFFAPPVGAMLALSSLSSQH